MPLSRRRPVPAALLLILCLLTIWAASDARDVQGGTPKPAAQAGAASIAPVASRTAPTNPAAVVPPAAVLKAFDSLLEAGTFPEARKLCTGQVLRMFDFIAAAQAKLADAVDTSRSKDSTLEEKRAGSWAYIKVSSYVAFSRPLLGQTEMRSVQAIHLYHAPQGWLIAEMEELGGEQAPVHLRTGDPTDTGRAGEKIGVSPSGKIPDPMNGLFPVSAKAPAVSGSIDRMQYRLRLKNGGPLEPYCVLGPEQARLRAENPSQWILENRRPVLRPSAHPSQPADSLRPFLASNTFLNLEDTALTSLAARIAGQETDPTALTGKIYAWVTDHFHFELGAVLFGTSSEVIRDLTGDCSEAAILSAALLRARGVPSRVAMGFASVGRGVFIGHAWSEAFLEGQWVGVDAALRQYPAGVERVKLAVLDGSGDMRVSATNLMMSVLSNLDIEILAAWKDGKPVPLRAYPDNSAEAGKFFDDILKGVAKKRQP